MSHFVVFVFVLLSSLQTQAQSFYLAGQAGVSDASGPRSTKTVGASYGGRLGWLFYDRIGIGAFVHYFQANAPGESIGYFPLLAEVTVYPFKKPVDDGAAFSLSGLFGSTKMAYDFGADQGTKQQTTFGFTGAYSIYFDPGFSLGPELQYFFVFSNESYALWSAQLTLKVWF